jgi:predicted RNase H-like nuclease
MPIWAALLMPDHAAASAASVRATGHGVSTQGYALRGRIRPLDVFLPRARTRMLEGHPEVSFAALAGAPLAHGKKSAAGLVERRRLLAAAGIEVPDDALAGLTNSGLDDVYDAAAMAWTARRVERGEAESLPDPPEVFLDRLRDLGEAGQPSPAAGH